MDLKFGNELPEGRSATMAVERGEGGQQWAGERDPLSYNVPHQFHFMKLSIYNLHIIFLKIHSNLQSNGFVIIYIQAYVFFLHTQRENQQAIISSQGAMAIKGNVVIHKGRK